MGRGQTRSFRKLYWLLGTLLTALLLVLTGEPGNIDKPANATCEEFVGTTFGGGFTQPAFRVVKILPGSQKFQLYFDELGILSIVECRQLIVNYNIVDNMIERKYHFF